MYDDFGRLLAVVDGTAGQAAIYQYDAAGNLLGITNQAASVVSILNFTPESGPVGTTVTISGTGFSATANQNTVKFNGTTATVTSATTTQLVATVPTGATTGPIAVTVGATSATTGASFTVTTSGVLGAPTITSFTPFIGVPGAAVTISGTNFDPALANDRVTFNAHLTTTTSATATSIGATVPPATGSGKISVATSLGQTLSSSYFFIPPSPYVASDVAVARTIVIGGSTVTPNITVANKIALVTCDGAANQPVTVRVTNNALGGVIVSLLNTDNTTLTSSTSSATSFNLTTQTLPTTGAYTILIDPTTTNTGALTLQVTTP